MAPMKPVKDRRVTLRRCAPWGAALLSGCLVFLAFPAADQGWLIWGSLVPLLLASADATPRRGFALGMVAGWLANVVGFAWMEHMLVTFGPRWMAWPVGSSGVAWLLVALGALYQALPWGAALGLTRVVAARSPAWAAAFFPLAFTGLEALHPILFPWFLGNSQHGRVLPIQIADLFGVYAVTLLIVSCNVGLWILAERVLRRRAVPLWPAAAAGALLAAALAYGAVRVAQVDAAIGDLPHLRVGVVEPEIPILQEQRKEYPEDTPDARILQENLLRLHRATLELAGQGVELVLWPESAWFPVPSVDARDAPFAQLALAQGRVWAREEGAWTPVEELGGVRWTCLAGGPEDRLMAGGEGGVVAAWRNGAWTRAPLPSPRTVTAVRALCDTATEWARTRFAPCWAFAATEDGALWLDGGQGWARVAADAPFAPEVLGGEYGHYLLAASRGAAVRIDGDGATTLSGEEAAAAARRDDLAASVPSEGLPGRPDVVVEVGWTSQPYWSSRAVRRFYQARSLPPEGPLEEALDRDLEAVGIPERNAPQRGTQVPILLGAITGNHVDMDDPGGLANTRYNSAVLVDRDGRVAGIYDKQLLLMFGEYLPFGGLFPRLYDWIPEAGRFTPGSDPSPLLWEGRRLGVLVCYEDILPEFTRRTASRGVDVLLNLTNDAWFGKTVEPAQHFALATLRAVEHRRWLVRSTSTGISGAVDPVGREVVRTDPSGAETFVVDVTLGGGSTLYQSVGPLLPAACLLGAAVLLVLARRRRVAGV
ncbi:MAG: apolipoprotein N-acyltransferase [Deltaproteobacteria bacterium]|nr:apolipoprotein N-acyltransferase [Deltaproteobacteria bacterium]